LSISAAIPSCSDNRHRFQPEKISTRKKTPLSRLEISGVFS
jgi:hypothetical protein